MIPYVVFAGRNENFYTSFKVSPDSNYLAFLGTDGYIILLSSKVCVLLECFVLLLGKRLAMCDMSYQYVIFNIHTSMQSRVPFTIFPTSLAYLMVWKM